MRVACLFGCVVLPPTVMNRVQLRVSCQRAYVWNVDDIAQLRSEHRICGVLTGTLPHLSQQNVFLGVPLLLMPEEVVLLVENQVAVLVDDPQSHREPSVPEMRQWDSERREQVRIQQAVAEAKLAKEVASGGRAMTEAAIQKRKEREEKNARGAERGAEADVSDNTDDPPSVPPGTVVLKPQPQPSSIPLPHHTVTIPASSSSLAWYDCAERAYTTITDAKAAGIWNYPESLSERARCGVFRGLWEQGYFMGSGTKFGGDYLVYPGDPLRYHSHFVATVLDSPTSVLRPMEIVAHGRLCTATKKAHLFCGWDDGKKAVSYFSVEWAGFG